MSAVVTRKTLGGRDSLYWHCPGCEETHRVFVDAGGWSWDGSMDRPTISPSVLIRFTRGDVPMVCHSFVRAGVVDFLGDCTHELAGRSVPMDPAQADPFALCEEVIDA